MNIPWRTSAAVAGAFLGLTVVCWIPQAAGNSGGGETMSAAPRPFEDAVGNAKDSLRVVTPSARAPEPTNIIALAAPARSEPITIVNHGDDCLKRINAGAIVVPAPDGHTPRIAASPVVLSERIADNSLVVELVDLRKLDEARARLTERFGEYDEARSGASRAKVSLYVDGKPVAAAAAWGPSRFVRFELPPELSSTVLVEALRGMRAELIVSATYVSETETDDVRILEARVTRAFTEFAKVVSAAVSEGGAVDNALKGGSVRAARETLLRELTSAVFGVYSRNGQPPEALEAVARECFRRQDDLMRGAFGPSRGTLVDAPSKTCDDVPSPVAKLNRVDAAKSAASSNSSSSTSTSETGGKFGIDMAGDVPLPSISVSDHATRASQSASASSSSSSLKAEGELIALPVSLEQVARASAQFSQHVGRRLGRGRLATCEMMYEVGLPLGDKETKVPTRLTWSPPDVPEHEFVNAASALNVAALDAPVGWRLPVRIHADLAVAEPRPPTVRDCDQSFGLDARLGAKKFERDQAKFGDIHPELNFEDELEMTAQGWQLQLFNGRSRWTHGGPGKMRASITIDVKGPPAPPRK